MTVKELIQKHSMNMKQLSDRFEIPYRTVQNWCASHGNKRECPSYVIKMMDEILSK